MKLAGLSGWRAGCQHAPSSLYNVYTSPLFFGQQEDELSDIDHTKLSTSQHNYYIVIVHLHAPTHQRVHHIILYNNKKDQVTQLRNLRQVADDDKRRWPSGRVDEMKPAGGQGEIWIRSQITSERVYEWHKRQERYQYRMGSPCHVIIILTCISGLRSSI